jgi:hypothetical protein
MQVQKNDNDCDNSSNFRYPICFTEFFFKKYIYISVKFPSIFFGYRGFAANLGYAFENLEGLGL